MTILDIGREAARLAPGTVAANLVRLWEMRLVVTERLVCIIVTGVR